MVKGFFTVRSWFFIIGSAGLLAFAAWLADVMVQPNWGMLSLAIITAILLFLYLSFEEGRVSAREIAVIAVLGALAAAGRVPLAAVPSVQPTTFLVIISGYIFGARAGFMVGSTAALASNLFLGQGPWTIWQMFAWGLAGFSAGLFRYILPNGGWRSMAAFQFGWGYIFGWIMNLWTWLAFIAPLTWQSLLATCAASFWFDSLHAAGNLIIYLLIGRGVAKALERAKRKLEFSYLQVENIAE
ncbi:MAG: ECF transporter S component [Syntrophomonas sp.]|nr:ECF transporter S component [Syntrophomonas sp.]